MLTKSLREIYRNVKACLRARTSEETRTISLKIHHSPIFKEDMQESKGMCSLPKYTAKAEVVAEPETRISLLTSSVLKRNKIDPSLT